MLRPTDRTTLTVSVAEAARAIGVSRSTIYRLAYDDPTFPPIRRIGKRLARIVFDDLVAWLETQPTIAEAADARRDTERLPNDEKQDAAEVASSQTARSKAGDRANGLRANVSKIGNNKDAVVPGSAVCARSARPVLTSR